MQLVELAEAAPEALPPGKSLFRDLYRDVRAAVDLCHRDGSLKSAVAANPGEYVHEDKKLAPLLRYEKREKERRESRERRERKMFFCFNLRRKRKAHFLPPPPNKNNLSLENL